MTQVNSLEEMKTLVKEWGKTLNPPHLVLLNGPMGAGKTQLVKFLVEQEEANSPTYSLINKYGFKGSSLYHIDFYRLEDEEDLQSTGFWDLFAEPDKIIVVEWAGRLEDSAWPKNWTTTRIDIQPQGDRRIVVIDSI